MKTTVFQIKKYRAETSMVNLLVAFIIMTIIINDITQSMLYTILISGILSLFGIRIHDRHLKLNPEKQKILWDIEEREWVILP